MRSILLAAAVFLVAQPASAIDLNGVTASGAYYYPTIANPYGSATVTPGTFVIGSGIEGTIAIEGVTTVTFDFAADSLAIAFDTILASPTWNSAAFNGAVFESTAFASITGVSVNPSTTFAGFDASRVSIVGNQLQLNWAGLGYSNDTTLSLSFTGPGSTVPEPGSWLMMIGGFGLVGAMQRRKKALPLPA